MSAYYFHSSKSSPYNEFQHFAYEISEVRMPKIESLLKIIYYDTRTFYELTFE